MSAKNNATKKDNSLCVQFGCNRKSTCGDYCSQHCNCNKKINQVVLTNTYTIKQIHYTDGTFEIVRENIGFNSVEVRALLELELNRILNK